MHERQFETAIGPCAILWQDQHITGFRLLAPPSTTAETTTSFEQPPASIQMAIKRVRAHLGGDLQDFADLPYAFERVSDFQRDVYSTALRVKAGQTWTYGQLAKAIGHPTAVARAVGTALGQNPWPLLVPCHRFVGADGHMTGFSAPGGIDTKLKLLALEGAQWFAV